MVLVSTILLGTVRVVWVASVGLHKCIFAASFKSRKWERCLLRAVISISSVVCAPEFTSSCICPLPFVICTYYLRAVTGMF